MSDQACPLPAHDDQSERERVNRMLQAKRIAVVGLSDDPSRPRYRVARYLMRAGKEILPVNPNYATVLGLRCYARLEEVPPPIDLVDVFRRAEYCAEVVRSAAAVGARGVWLQSGIRSEKARQAAEEAGIDYVEDRCLMVEHMRSS